MFYKSKSYLILLACFISFLASPLFIKHGYCMDDESHWYNKSRNNNLLHIAAEKGDDQQLRQLLGQGWWVSKLASMNNEGYAPLHLAVQINSVSKALILLEAGANINQTVTRNGSRTSLDLCLDQNPVNLDMLKVLLQTGSLIGECLNNIIRTGNAQIVSLILEYGRNINVNVNEKKFSRFSPPLHHAVSLLNSSTTFSYSKNGVTADYKKIVELLLKKGANPNQPDISDGKTPCHLAVEKSDTDKPEVEDVLNLLLNHGADATVADKDLSTPLHLASSKGSIKTLEMLLGKTKNVNPRDKEGRTPLHLAVSLQSFEKTASLLKHRADVTAVDNKLSTPLHLASQADSSSIVSLLLSAGANANKQNQDEKLPLHLAAYSFKEENIEMLLPNTHDVNKVDKRGSTPLHLMLMTSPSIKSWEDKQESITLLEKRLIQLIKSFIFKGADLKILNEEGNSYLHLAFIRGYHNIASLFLDCEIEVNAINKKGESPLFLAIKKENNQIVEPLLKKGANPNQPNISDGKTPCHLAVERSHTDKPEVEDVLNLLLNHGADVTVADKNLSTPLHLASSKGSIKTLEMLLERTRNVNPRDKEKRTPLHLTISSKSFEKTERLLEHGADVTAVDTRGSTPLHLMLMTSPSIKQGEDLQESIALLEKRLIQLIKSFISKGADLKILSEEGNSFLHLAFIRGYHNIASLFLDCGIEVNATNKKGESPLFLAVNEEINHPIIERLLKLGADPNHADAPHTTSTYGLSPRQSSIPRSLKRIHARNENLPFYMAWTKRYGSIVRLLLNNNADPNVEFSKKTPSSIRVTTPLEEAAESHNIEAVVCLLKHGAKVPEGLICTLIKTLHEKYIRGRGYTSRRYMHQALNQNDLEIIALLLKHGGEPNAPDEFGDYPLEKIFLQDLEFYNPVIQMLHQAGASHYLFEDRKIQILDLQKLALKSLLQTSKSSPESLRKFYEVLEPLPTIKEIYFKEFFLLGAEKKSLEDKLSDWLNKIDLQEKAEIERKRIEERKKQKREEREKQKREDENRSLKDWTHWTERDEERWLRDNCS